MIEPPDIWAFCLIGGFVVEYMLRDATIALQQSRVYSELLSLLHNKISGSMPPSVLLAGYWLSHVGV